MLHRMRFIICIVFLFTIYSVQLPQPSHAQGNTLPVFEPTACPFDALPNQVEGQTYECGALFVPENRTDPNSAEIGLAVVIIYSNSPNPLPDPVVYLEGGPGGSAIAGMDAWIGTPFSTNRDIILIDQRGTGYSAPSLNCWELDEMEDETSASQACYNRLVSEGIDLSAYNSAENAADINDLRIALGLEQVNLYGISYGTRLALTVLRDYPEGVRSAVIDAVFPPHVQGYEEQTLYAGRAFNQLFDDCAADPACNATYPELETTLLRVIDGLNANPGVVVDDYGETELYGDDLVNAIYGAFYATNIVPNLPLAIALIDEGDLNAGVAIISGATPEEILDGVIVEDEAPFDENARMPYDIDSDAEGMFNAVECNEELPFQTYDRAVGLSASVTPQIREAMLIGVNEQFAACAIWQTGSAPALENEPVVSNIPVLVLSGAYDPITPPAWGQAAADYLSNSFNFVFPGVGHGSIDGGDCPVGIATAFIDMPTRQPDSSCIASMRVNFYTGAPPAAAVESGAPASSMGDQTAAGIENDIYALLVELDWTLPEFEEYFLDYNDITMDDLVEEILDGYLTLEELAAILSE